MCATCAVILQVCPFPLCHFVKRLVGCLPSDDTRPSRNSESRMPLMSCEVSSEDCRHQKNGSEQPVANIVRRNHVVFKDPDVFRRQFGSKPRINAGHHETHVGPRLPVRSSILIGQTLPLADVETQIPRIGIIARGKPIPDSSLDRITPRACGETGGFIG